MMSDKIFLNLDPFQNLRLSKQKVVYLDKIELLFYNVDCQRFSIYSMFFYSNLIFNTDEEVWT